MKSTVHLPPCKARSCRQYKYKQEHVRLYRYRYGTTSSIWYSTCTVRICVHNTAVYRYRTSTVVLAASVATSYWQYGTGTYTHTRQYWYGQGYSIVAVGGTSIDACTGSARDIVRCPSAIHVPVRMYRYCRGPVAESTYIRGLLQNFCLQCGAYCGAVALAAPQGACCRNSENRGPITDRLSEKGAFYVFPFFLSVTDPIYGDSHSNPFLRFAQNGLDTTNGSAL